MSSNTSDTIILLHNPNNDTHTQRTRNLRQNCPSTKRERKNVWHTLRMHSKLVDVGIQSKYWNTPSKSLAIDIVTRKKAYYSIKSQESTKMRKPIKMRRPPKIICIVLYQSCKQIFQTVRLMDTERSKALLPRPPSIYIITVVYLSFGTMPRREGWISKKLQIPFRLDPMIKAIEQDFALNAYPFYFENVTLHWNMCLIYK